MTRRRVLLLGAGVLMIGAIELAVQWSLRPIKTVPENTASNTIVEGATSKLAPFNSPYASSLLSDSVRLLRKNEAAGDSILAQYLYVRKKAETNGQIAITIGKSAGTIGEVSAVKARLLDQNKYIQTSRQYAPLGSVVFMTEDPYEIGIFWQNDTYYAAVVASGTADQKTILEELASDLVSNWQWR